VDGLAGALLNAEVRAAFLAVPGAPVRLFIFEWAGPNTQNTLIPWRDITDDNSLYAIATTLISNPRQASEVSTALGQAMLFGGQVLASQGDCWRLTLDLSGDGQSNIGPRPQDIQQSLPPQVTINAIVVGADTGTSQGAIDSEISRLTSYFRSQVIRGPNAFVEAALGFEEFETAMTRKLLKELQVLSVGNLIPATQ